MQRKNREIEIAISMKRPAHLPDFENPPVSEVILGVQFRTPAGYSQIYAGEVWSLFKSDFPGVEEHPPLPPIFETFGPQRSIVPPFNVITGASHDRFWFVSEDTYQLIQFQQDRILHNWRKMGSAENAYPRYEHMIGRFQGELEKFSDFVSSLDPSPLEINQCEITYINIIKLSEIENSKAATWLNGFDLPNGGPDDFAYTFKKPILGNSGEPTGRLSFEIVSALTQELEPVIRMTITARGAPATSSIDDAIKYMNNGRELIVNGFTEITSEAAHKVWKRKS